MNTHSIRATTRSAALSLALLGSLGCGAKNTPVQPASEEPANEEPAVGPGTGTNTDAPTQPDRIRVLMEIDQVAGTTPLDVERVIDGATVSLVDIYGRAGVDLTIVRDQSDIVAPSPLRLGHLHGLMIEHRSIAAAADELHVYCLVAPKDSASPDTLGIMFDFQENDENNLPREAFAVFSEAHAGLAGGAATEMFLTTAHEFAHCFNLHHTDWQGGEFFNAATVESYSMADSVIWDLSAASKDHLASHPRPFVVSGPGSQPFSFITQHHQDRHQNYPSETYSVVADDPAARRPGVYALAVGREAVSREASAVVARSLRLELSAPRTSYELGEPIAVTISLRNVGDEPVEIMNLLDPDLGFTQVMIEDRSSGARQAWHSPLHANARGRLAEPTTIAAGESIVTTASVFLGTTGWTFRKAGTWGLRASFSVPFRGQIVDLESGEIEITCKQASDANLRRSIQRDLVDDREAGIFLYLGGGEHLKKGRRNLEKLLEQFPSSAQAAGAGFALSAETVFQGTGKAVLAELEQAEAELAGAYGSAATPEQLLGLANGLARKYEEHEHSEHAHRVRIRALEELLPAAERPDLDALKDADLAPIIDTKSLEQLKKNAAKAPR